MKQKVARKRQRLKRAAKKATRRPAVWPKVEVYARLDFRPWRILFEGPRGGTREVNCWLVMTKAHARAPEQWMYQDARGRNLRPAPFAPHARERASSSRQVPYVGWVSGMAPPAKFLWVGAGL